MPAPKLVVWGLLPSGWEPIGSVVPNRGGVTAAAFGHRAFGGADFARFTIEADPRIVGSLFAGTHIYIELGGVQAWSGRIRETPTHRGDGQHIEVVCEGWKEHLQDDVLDRFWVLSDKSSWFDTRGLKNASSTYWTGEGIVSETGFGARTLMWPDGAGIAASERLGITLDLGPNRKCEAFNIAYKLSGNSNATSLFILGHDSDDPNDPQNGFSKIIAFGTAGAIGGPTTFTSLGLGESGFTKATRYITVAMARGVTPGVLQEPVSAYLYELQIYSDAAYLSSNSSRVRAATVIKDTLTRGAPKISTDQSRMKATHWRMPEFATDGYQSPLEIVERARKVEPYQFQLSNDPVPKGIFEPSPMGGQNLVERGTFEQTDAADAVDGWSVAAKTNLTTAGTSLAVSSTQSYVLSKSLEIVLPATSGSGARYSLPGYYLPGRTYLAKAWIRSSTATHAVNLRVGDSTQNDVATSGSVTLSTTWQLLSVEWTPQRECNDVYLAIRNGAATACTAQIDSVTIKCHPSVPRYVVGAQDGVKLEGANTNAISEIFNQVRASYTGTDGVTGLVTASGWNEEGVQLQNPSFDTDTTGWSVSAGGTIARNTARYYSPPASMSVINTAANPATITVSNNTFTRPLMDGVKYRITVKAYDIVSAGQTKSITIAFGGSSTTRAFGESQAWELYTHTFVYDSATMSGGLAITLTAFTTFSNFVEDNIDGVRFETYDNTYLDKTGTVRTKVLEPRSISSASSAEALANSVLSEILNPPLRGSVTATGYIREYETGALVHVGEIRAGEAILLEDEPDPTTGNLGRIGIIAATSYDHNAQTCQITIDSELDIYDLMTAQAGGA